MGAATIKSSHVIMILFIIIAIGTGVYVLRDTFQNQNQHKQTTEGFASWADFTATSLNISFCPLSAPEIQTSRGSTDCCEGDFIDGKCKGRTFCTQSPTHDGIKSCIEAWRDYFRKQGEKHCTSGPEGLPHYYENVKVRNGIKGCSASPVHESGAYPQNAGAKFCRIYESDWDNQRKANSCYNEKRRLALVCPNVPNENYQAKIKEGNGEFQYLMCEYSGTTTGGIPSFCGEDNTFGRYNDSIAPNWRRGKDAGVIQESFCSDYLNARLRREMRAKKAAEEKAARELAERKARDERDLREKAEANWRAALDSAKNERERAARAQSEWARQFQDLQAKCKSETINLIRNVPR
jgi:hypothetical protein